MLKNTNNCNDQVAPFIAESVAKKTYFSAEEVAHLLGKAVCFKKPFYYQYLGVDMKRLLCDVGGIQSVYLATNTIEGITISFFIDGDIEEMTKDEFEFYCEVVSCSGNAVKTLAN